MPKAAASFATKRYEFLLNAAQTWMSVRELKKRVRTLSEANDDFDFASCGMAGFGELSPYSSAVETVRVYVANQKDKLSDLARQDEDYWMNCSGANVLDPASMMKAKIAVCSWSENFSQLKYLIQQFLPAVQAAQSLVGKTECDSAITLHRARIGEIVVARRSYFDDSSLPLLDKFALNQVIEDLNISVRSIDVVLQRLRNCWLAMR